jgi:hypothetical protein
MADESLVTPDDAEALIAHRTASWFNIRISKNGGLIPCLRLAMLARRHGMHLLCGGFPERSGTPGKCLNASVLLGADGRILGHYCKMHLFDVSLPGRAEYRESEVFEGGPGPVVVSTGLGPIGLSVCYDLRFPELYRACAVARELCIPHRIGRVIARPFAGDPGGFRRTPNRRDYSFPLPGPTILDVLQGRLPVISDLGGGDVSLLSLCDEFCPPELKAATRTAAGIARPHVVLPGR